MHFLSAAYQFARAHQAAAAAFLLVVLPTVITGLTPYPKAAGVVSALRMLLNLVSLLSHRDSPGIFKLPLTLSQPPPLSYSDTLSSNRKGFARLQVLVMLAIAAAVMFAAGAARADDPPKVVPVLPLVAVSDPPPPPEPQFGGCVNGGHLCFGPSVAMTVAALNLKTKAIEGAFSPGVGFGVTLNPGRWSSLGADFYFTLDPAAQRAAGSFMAKFFNGYFRVGISKGIIGDVAWRVPIAIGIPLP